MKLQYNIEDILLSQYKINQEMFENYYDKILSNIKLALKTYEHRLKIYSHMKNRLHYQHFMIKKRIDNEMDIEEKNTQQLRQFQILQTLANYSSKDQAVIVNRLKVINSDSKKKYKEMEIEKTKQINSLQFDIEIIKKNSDEYEKLLNDTKARNLNLSKMVDMYIEKKNLLKRNIFQ